MKLKAPLGGNPVCPPIAQRLDRSARRMHFPRGRVYQACLSNTAHCAANVQHSRLFIPAQNGKLGIDVPGLSCSPRHASAQAKVPGLSVRASTAPENRFAIRVPPCTDTSSTAPAPC